VVALRNKERRIDRWIGAKLLWAERRNTMGTALPTQAEAGGDGGDFRMRKKQTTGRRRTERKRRRIRLCMRAFSHPGGWIQGISATALDFAGFGSDGSSLIHNTHTCRGGV
jgi:hypothetical protein